MFRCQQGTAPLNLSSEPQHVSDAVSGRRLRSASTTALVVPRMHRSTIGNRAFPVAAARVWNSLSPAVTQSPSLSTFRRKLKTELFCAPIPILNRFIASPPFMTRNTFLYRDFEVLRNYVLLMPFVYTYINTYKVER